jgi:adenosylcobinamide kinase/adenosylcobinamide-phosphate guanylyltransferase
MDRGDGERTLKGATGEGSGAGVRGGPTERTADGGARERACEQERAARPARGGRAGDAPITLILGGARSGKSTLAERLAAESRRPVLYLATSVPFDDEMAERIAAHRADRPNGWRTVEEPLRIAAAIRDHARSGDLVLLDCLTVWLSNLLLDGIGPNRDPDAIPAAEWRALEAAALAEIDALLADARARGTSLVLVSNEVGLGVVPAYPLGRRYRDALGRVNQRVASRADDVLLTVAGLALDLKHLRSAGSP